MQLHFLKLFTIKRFFAEVFLSVLYFILFLGIVLLGGGLGAVLGSTTLFSCSNSDFVGNKLIIDVRLSGWIG
jgi:hypothetical protein